MCILFFAANPKPAADGYRLVLINNRDEYFVRPTQPAHYWKSNSNIIGGMDLEPGKEGGTWLAMTTTGKIGVLLNVLQPVGVNNKTKKGRGYLVPDFLCGNEDGVTFMEHLVTHSQEYNSFNMVTLDLMSQQRPSGFSLCHYSNLSTYEKPIEMETGVHGFGNSPLTSPWRKVTHGRKLFEDIVNKHPSTDTMTQLVEELIGMLNDSTSLYPDPQLQFQGQGRSHEVLSSLSALCVKIPSISYGSRTNTIILVDTANQVTFIERTMKEPIDPANANWLTSEYCYYIQQG